MKNSIKSLVVAVATGMFGLGAASDAKALVVPVVEDVMTSSFFIGSNTVRGYSSESRPVFRVSTENPFGLTGAETIYLTFNASDFTSLSGSVPSAILSIDSAAGGQGADADIDNPFQVSAHAVNANPLTTIIDDTNPGGTVSWLNFYNNNILPASAAATTTVTGFGQIQFDITQIVNDWISGANTVFAIALTGKNHTLNDGEYLHGFVNNNDNGSVLGSTYITVVPEPASLGVLALGAVTLLRRRSR